MRDTEYASRIAFRFIQPDTRLSQPYNLVNALLRRLNIRVEALNTRLPAKAPDVHRKLYDLCAIPKMSTFDNGAIINHIVAQMPPGQAFVNIGVWHGFTFLAGMINNAEKICVGVDNFSQFDGPRQEFLARFGEYKSEAHRFYDMDYKAYFAEVHQEPIGFYIYDGEHSYENQLDGLQLAEPFFAEDCVILVDDTNYSAPRQGTLDFVANSAFEYRVLFDRQTSNHWHPTFWNGIMLLQRNG